MKKQNTILLAFTILSITACSKKAAHQRGEPYGKGISDIKHITTDKLHQAQKSHNPQDKADAGIWFTLDPKANGVEGVSSELAYARLSLKKDQAPIIVAVVDGGVDITHEDLQGHIWTNEAEANGQPGVDDDHNGYVDDIHGWNFIGGYDADGKPVSINQETLEVTRIAKKLTDKKAAGVALSAEEEALYKETTDAINDERKTATDEVDKNQKAIDALKPQFEIIKSIVGGDLKDLTLDTLNSVSSTDQAVLDAKTAIVQILTDAKSKSAQRLFDRIDYYTEELQYNFNMDFNARAEIVKDNPEDITDTHYGNNDVTGPDASHGTHVSGIIAALRHNGLGTDGIAENVRIMAVRVVPNGDERDKDVALGIRYAVDNGARIINMSFGKGYSPQKTFVDEAMKYAASKGVLLVHAAGNENANNDSGKNFPDRELNTPDELGNDEVSTWVEVGASSALKGENLPADFSNYGRRKVDVFAPGVDILSTVPGNQYDIYSGTSMASPAFTGVAALVMSQFPKMTALEVKDYILSSSRRYPGLQVVLPGTDDTKVAFSELSRTGSVSDVFTTLKNLFHRAKK